ncbi:SMF family protein [Bacteroides coprosuis DSM 18011]|uniref:SMF family protein n=1 Tax=Bacteroides coprosuis DSM 18011 TaxID=679937 RepID=F3ZNV0_9BACE|nr:MULTISPECIES: DNA-processing protein DprA [Bacteroides]EGJ71526.1 SMF family protein [Bacteroides coprosuis DSM 18011]HJD91726.1 DNA-protecting protein DprA [Bacteroides coprosuis]
MALTTEQLLTLSKLEGLGKVTLTALQDYGFLKKVSIDTSRELLDFYVHCKTKKLFRLSKIYTLHEVQEAHEQAQIILERSQRLNIRCISKYESSYPVPLRSLTHQGKDDAPCLLFYKGDLTQLKDRTGIAVVGTQKPTQEGIKTAQYIASYLAERGINIVSGLADGCDTYAHIGALNQKGITTAVLAHGLEKVYPYKNSSLADRILASGGVVLSEYPIGEKLVKSNFIQRDRIQAGLSAGTIVIQSSKNSGSRYAVFSSYENNRPVWAVNFKNPELLNSPEVQGNISLIKDMYAKPLSSSQLSQVLSLVP